MSPTDDHQDTEQPLLRQVALGVPTAVSACIDRYGGLVWSIARRLAPTPAETEDAVQEIFIELWKSAGRHDPRLCSEKTFVAMLARRRLLDRRRRHGRRPELRPLPDVASDLPDEQHLAMEGQAEAALAARALGGLEPEQRRILKLSIHYGMSHGEIAGLLDLPLGTVKSHIRRGLTAVRKLLAPPPAPAPERISP